MFLSSLLGKGSIGSPVQYCVKVVYVLKSNTGKRFYRFTSPFLGKGSRFFSPIQEKDSIGSPVQYRVKGCICSQVQYWKKVLGSPVHFWEKAL